MNRIKFLGTSGGRFVLIHQIRRSGGTWITLDDTNLFIDPGPGSLVSCLKSRPKLKPRDLDGIILTHRHLDHSNDINLMIEAMANGGFNKKGVVFAPSDALEEDPVVLKHFRDHLDKIVVLKEKGKYKIGNIKFETPVSHVHGVETYGLNIYGKNGSISMITDTKYFDGLESFYKGDVLIINFVMLKETKKVLHLNLKDIEKIISKNKPKLCVLTHFGMNVLRARPWEIAKSLSEKCGIKVVAANDGMQIELDEYI